MRVAVCVKQVPDPAVPPSFDTQTGRIDRSGKLVMDEADSYGVEVALRLAGSAFDGGQDESGEVVVISMVPRAETSGLRQALAMGAARALVVSDEALAGSDALSTADVLAAAVRKIEPDLVICATESTDGYTGTLGACLAELLSLPSVTFARSVLASEGAVLVERQTESGFEEVSCPYPALVSVTAGVVEPRYPTFKGIVAARSKPVEVLSLAELGIEVSAVGEGAAHQEVLRVSTGKERQGGEVVLDDGNAHEAVVSFLESARLI